MKETSSRECLNCGTEVNGSFCSKCGQKIKLTRLTFRSIIIDFLNTVFNIDSPFPRTLIGLFVKPGVIIQEILAGKRKMYYAPVRYLIVCTAISLIISSLIDFDPIENQKAMGESNTNSSQEALEQEEQVSIIAGNFLHQNINYFLFILPFCIAIVTRLFFYKQKLFLAERTVLGLYLSGQTILIMSCFMILTLIDPMFMVIGYLVIMAYFSFGFYQFHDKGNKLWHFVKSFLSGVISYLLYIVVSFALALGIVIVFKI